MNAKQKKRIEEIAHELREMSESEQTKLDNLPDSLRDSARGESFEAAADFLCDAADTLEAGLSN